MMSKVKPKTNDSAAKTKPPVSKTININNAKKKNKFWYEEKVKTRRPQSNKQVLPPTDAQHFSANWKALQEKLKSTPPEQKQPVTPKPQNGALPKKKAKENSSKDTSKIDNTGPAQTGAGKKGKPKSTSNSVVSKDNLKVPDISQTKPSTAPKRKGDGGKSNSAHAAKRKKPVVEETKLTEDDLWFDDVDPDDIEATVGAEAAEIMRKKQGIRPPKDAESALVKEKAFEGLTRAVAIDCEMVGVGLDGEDSILARVSLVNHFGKCIYDKYVKPTEKVTDYRTAVSGIRPNDIKDGEDVHTVQKEVAEILQGRIVVGHAIHNDLKILLLDHPKKKIRDTQKYKPFKKRVKTGRPSLKVLCREILNVKVQQGEHSSVQDAQATMRLYTMARKQWEAEIKASHQNKHLDKKSERKPRSPKSKGKKPTGL
ncbi:RNA exonuclease 4 [Hippoglossus stenolepis]|uniref:RNA exonuclease 4 n=1 Tax=Hippoglossus stenolepis TaxID=195615 RepID=UPI00159C2963|nr:RNA exonuclease 4 [Hippoglossus stenolepis]